MTQSKYIPDEVIRVWYIQEYVKYVGGDVYNECQEIIKKYPEYFKWETTYSNIPKEVHEAYLDERYPDRHKPIERDGKGLQELIESSKLKNYTSLSVDKISKILDEFIESQIKQEEIEKELWDKHYKKYNLEYRK